MIADIAAARFLASVRAGTPDFAIMDGLAEAKQPVPAATRSPMGAAAALAAYLRAEHELSRQLAKDAGAADIWAVPPERRASIRGSALWRGLAAGLDRWSEGERFRPDHLIDIARIRLDLGDRDGARTALERAQSEMERFGSNQLMPYEARLWRLLGDRSRAEKRSHSSWPPVIYRFDLKAMAIEALARHDKASALALLDELWERGGDRRGIVRLTAEAGDPPLAMARAEAIRDLAARGELWPLTNYPPAHAMVYAAGAFNDIGEHASALRMLRDLLASGPTDLTAAVLGDAPRLFRISRPVDLPKDFPCVNAAAELVRAGRQDAAAKLLRATQPQDPGLLASDPAKGRNTEAPVKAGRTRAEATKPACMGEGAAWEWLSVVRQNAPYPDHVAGLLALTSGFPDAERIQMLMSAAGGYAWYGRAELAAARLQEAMALFGPKDGRHWFLCDVVVAAARLGRDDIADAGFRSAVADAREQPEAVRPMALVHAAACRGAPRLMPRLFGQ